MHPAARQYLRKLPKSILYVSQRPCAVLPSPLNTCFNDDGKLKGLSHDEMAALSTVWTSSEQCGLASHSIEHHKPSSYHLNKIAQMQSPGSPHLLSTLNAAGWMAAAP